MLVCNPVSSLDYNKNCLKKIKGNVNVIYNCLERHIETQLSLLIPVYSDQNGADYVSKETRNCEVKGPYHWRYVMTALIVDVVTHVV